MIMSFKTIAFLSYHTAKHMFASKVHGPAHDPIRDVCRCGIDFLCDLLKKESSQKYIISQENWKYLNSMFYAESVGDCEVGLGPNGLASIFGFIMRTPSRSKEEILDGI